VPRQMPIEHPGAICHGLNRGDRREAIIRDHGGEAAGGEDVNPGAGCAEAANGNPGHIERKTSTEQRHE